MAAGNIASHLKEASLRLPGQKDLSAKTHGFLKNLFRNFTKTPKPPLPILSQGVRKGDKTLLFVRSGYELIVLAFALFFSRSRTYSH